jgi:hypothetical protein
MLRSIFSLCAVMMLTLAGCAKEGTVYNAPVDQVYSKLLELDLGDKIDSGLWRIYDPTPAIPGEPNKTVSWKLGKGAGSFVTANLEDEGSGTTRVRVDIIIPEGAMEARLGAMAGPAGALARNLIKERIASYIEDRPFNDQKYIDAMYGGNASLVPKEIRDQAGAALKMDAEMQRDQRESRERRDSTPAPSQSSVSRSDVMSGAPMVDTRPGRN